jgi:hypothetical protein
MEPAGLWNQAHSDTPESECASLTCVIPSMVVGAGRALPATDLAPASTVLCASFMLLLLLPIVLSALWGV